MDNDLLAGFVVLAGLTFLLNRRRKRWNSRQYWVRPINRLREHQGDFHHLFQEMKEDANMFFRYTRMTVPVFYKLLEMIEPHIQKKSWRALSPELRLALTLRYLATGDQILSIALAYRIGESTAYAIVKETCFVLTQVLAPIYLQPPSLEQWKDISAGFWREWNFPNCVGAIDGKHIQIQAPPNSGSLYYNYKKTFSIVLMAACSFDYKFTLIDVGSYGSDNDAGVFGKSEFGVALEEERLGLPAGTMELPGSNIKTPYSFVGDEAFPLKRNLMRPYPGRNIDERKTIFNYRLSRARRTIENAFGILVSRWRIFRRPICMHPASVDRIVMATICLHNFLKTDNDARSVENRVYCSPNFVDNELEDGSLIPGAWRNDANNGISNLRPTNAHRATQDANLQRELLATYFLTPQGEVPWEYDYVRRGENSAN